MSRAGEPDFEPEWVRFPKECPVEFVGRDTIFMGRGCHLYFLNLSTGQESIYAANINNRGDGVKCYTGHRQLPLFAFAEKCLKPRIMFVRYPDFLNIKTLCDGAPEGYRNIAFTDQEYFITLSSLPIFEFVVWNWRTLEKLAAVETKTTHIAQSICVSQTTPITVAQYYEGSNHIIIWEIQPAHKHCFLLRRDVKLPYRDTLAGVTWNPDGQFFVLNNNGCIYILNPDHHLDYLIRGPKLSNTRQCFTWHKNGFFIAEENFGVKHVKKDGDIINRIETGRTGFYQLVSNGRDTLIGWTTKSVIMELETNQFVQRKVLSNDLVQFCWVYPSCDDFVALRGDFQTLNGFNATTGNEESTIVMDKEVSIINSNPIYSYVVAALNTGTLVFISFFKIKNPVVMCKFRINRKTIDRIIFTESGANVVTANTNLGLFFVLHAIPGEPITLVNFIDYQRPILDFCVMEDKYHYKLLLLVPTKERPYSTSRIVVKTIVKMSGVVKKKKYKSPSHSLRNVKCIDNVFYSTVFGKEIICRFILHKKKIEFLPDLNFNHFTSLVTLDHNPLHIISYGFNGFVCIRDKVFKPQVFIVAHHRRDAGIAILIADPFLRYTVSRGKKGEIVSMKILNHADKYLQKYKGTLTDQFELGEKFSKPTVGFFPQEDITYLEKKEEEMAHVESEKCAKEKKAIMDEFLSIKKEVVSLLEANLEGPEMEKIDILDFYLHTRLKEHREKMADLEAAWTVKYYKELIRAQTELWNCMKQKFWDTQLVKRSLIKGIFSNFEVENYGLIEANPKVVDQYKYVLMFREFEELLKTGDIFEPWIPASDSEILAQLEKPPAICHKSESTRIMEALQDLENEEESVVTKKETYPSSDGGEIMEKHMYYDQAEIHTYSQFVIQMHLTAWANRELRSIFNVKYDEIMQFKVREMNSIIEKNNRLRFILSELKNNSIYIEDPEWGAAEKPESIITVQENEIAVRPYISPSRQAQLDWQAAEEERIRLLLLADDFREKALIKMMDGVLEVRWEDTLKRDVPKPKCMLEKDPETFNEEDLRTIREYEEKCTFLNIERQRYKNMLESEYGRNAEFVKESAKKFNSRLRDLLLLKINTETTRCQHLLLLQIINKMMNERTKMKTRQSSIKDNIGLNEKEIAALQENLSELNDGLVDCKTNGETLFTKEKTLEKLFKKDYQEYSALIQEQGHRLYRRQPRVHLKNITMPTVILELATACVSHEKSPVLVPECLDFLRSLDNLDQFVGVPNTIDENMYKVICKHRRLKIENELKMKANLIEQSNIEQTIQVYQKHLNEKKEKNTKLVNDLQTSRVEKLHFIHDKKIQLVVKRGLVEVPLTGFMNDFENAVMVNRKEVEYVNGLITKAGERKIKVMTDKLVHRRQILMKEWQHKKMKMEIEDLKDYLLTVEKVKVTKEIQRYLRQRAKGEQFDKGTLTLDQEIECRKAVFEKTLIEKQTAVKELDRQIKEYKKSNKVLDQKIAQVNIDVCEQEANRDVEFEHVNKNILKKRMSLIVRRSRLVKQIQDQHNEILILQTELELLRLKTYPTLKFKTL